MYGNAMTAVGTRRRRWGRRVIATRMGSALITVPKCLRGSEGLGEELGEGGGGRRTGAELEGKGQSAGVDEFWMEGVEVDV
jgi:hypothetical protein